MRAKRFERTILRLGVVAVLGAGALTAGAADDGVSNLVSRVAGEGSVFAFTKLDANGEALDNQDAVYTITQWHCVRDESTGLTWEVKTIDGGLRDQNHTYTWFNPDPQENGGAPGREDGGECNGSRCDTHAYAQAVNDEDICGHNDWRLPTRAELRTIVNYQASFPAIDIDYFPNTVARSFWTAEPNPDYPDYAWHTDFKFGLASYYFFKWGPKAVRLVRGGE